MKARKIITLNCLERAKWSVAAVVTALAISPGPAMADADEGRSLLFQAAFVRETIDRDWRISIRGRIASLPGAFLLVHADDGTLLAKRHLPHGDISTTQQIVFTADGRTGDYRITIVGHQDDLLGMVLPLTDLPLEVYGHKTFASRREDAWWFRVTEGPRSMTFTATNGLVRVEHAGQTVFDLAQAPESPQRQKRATHTLDPNIDYELHPYHTFYFGVLEGVFLSLDPERWFEPGPALIELAWWRLCE